MMPGQPSNDARDTAATRPMPPHVWLRYAGLVVLLGGLLGAIAIYVLAPSDVDADPAADITRHKMYEHDIALIGGKGAIYALRLNAWFASLWQGTSLAYTVAVLSVVVAASCFGLAWLMAMPEAREGVTRDTGER